MLLARVEGNIVATRKHPSLDGWRLVICQPIGASGEAGRFAAIAIDSHGAGMHQQVIISSDGWRRARLGVDKSPGAGWSLGSWMKQEPGRASSFFILHMNLELSLAA